MSELDVLRVKFTHSNTVREKKPYTIYEIEVRSSSTITWVIYKRYTAFYALHQHLLKAILALPEPQRIQLPALPPKRLTRSLAVEFVEKRKVELQDYLRALLDTPGLLPSAVLLSFLEVPDSVRPMLFAASAHRGPSLLQGMYDRGAGDGASYDREGKDAGGGGAGGKGPAAYQHKTFEERRTMELIHALKHSTNKVSAIKAYEWWFFDQKPRLSPELIRVLFAGKSGQEGEGGLIVVCGEVHYSHVAARAALHLLLRFLDVEKNKDAQYFLDVFLTLDLSLLKRMQLHQHIISERGNRLSAFRLIHAYRNAAIAHRSSVMAAPASVDASVQLLIGDGWAVKEYYKWSERRTEGVVMIKGREGVEVESGVPNMSEVNTRSVVQSTVEEVIRAWRDDEAWREVRMCEGVADVDGDVRLEYKKGREGGIVVRMQTVMPYAADVVSAVIGDWARRREWDIKYQTHEVLARVLLGEGEEEKEEDVSVGGGGTANDGNQEEAVVVHYTYKSFASPYKYRDVLLLTATVSYDADRAALSSTTTTALTSPAMASASSLSPSSTSSTSSFLSPSSAASPSSASEAGPPPPPTPLPPAPSSVLHLMRSVMHPSLPETKQRQRAAFHSSAYIVTPLPSSPPSPPSSLVTLLLSCDKESVLIVSADLLGETNELRQSFVNLARCCGEDDGEDGKRRRDVGVTTAAGSTQRLSSLLHSAINAGDTVTAAHTAAAMAGPVPDMVKATG